MIKRKILKKKRKNPEIDIIEFLENLKPFEKNIKTQSLAEGGYGETYIFQINNRKVLDNGQILKPGEYLIKRFFNNKDDGPPISKKEIAYLSKLSNYGLIPKIYHISNKYVIMKFVEALPLSVYFDNDMLSESDADKITERLYFLISKWHKLGFAHGDISYTNILVTSKKQVYLIDPDASLVNVLDINYYQRGDLSDLRRITNQMIERAM